MIVEVRNKVSDFNSYRAARVKSLFNAENGCNFNLTANINIENYDWKIGVIAGPSGSGKTSLGKKIFGGESHIYDLTKDWPKDKPIIDAILPSGNFDDVTGALASVGLGNVPAWLRPFYVLSNGEQFRAGLARLICERPIKCVIDEFTSVIDRQIAKIGAQAFQKAWRRNNTGQQIVLLTPHYDILDWIEPDWVFDTKDNRFERGRLRRRPKFSLEVRKVDSSYWKYFKQHYYLDLPMPVAPSYFIGTVNGELACHIAVTPKFESRNYRATRLVTMPEWQGAGVGTKFLEWICQFHLEGNGVKGKKFTTVFHTSHPQLCAYFRRSSKWIQISSVLYGGNKKRCLKSMAAAGGKTGAGYGGHFRAVQGFKYIGEKAI